VTHVLRTVRCRRSDLGFTLLELLVVVAIIVLLISILLPSLSKARAQARTTLCAARLSQLTKSLFLYADDFNERFPFHIVFGVEPAWGGGGYNPGELDPNEDWIASKSEMVNVFFSNEQDWPALGVHLPQSGCLFPYTRFASIYGCPEFARRPENGIAEVVYHSQTAQEGQRVFNYTRGPWCRRPTFQVEGGFRLAFDGPIMTISKVHASSLAVLLLDESWYANVGRGRPAPVGSYWASDPVWDVSSSLGLYHGAPIVGEAYFRYNKPYFRTNVPAKQANIAFYDGHIDLYRDPCPLLDGNRARLTLELLLQSKDVPRWINIMVYALIGTSIEGI
jgi:prepilin-type N-terminal cleavage/methylation domain-containing protein/prepilin-type processing-associated H-X9-DG protein